MSSFGTSNFGRASIIAIKEIENGVLTQTITETNWRGRTIATHFNNSQIFEVGVTYHQRVERNPQTGELTIEHWEVR